MFRLFIVFATSVFLSLNFGALLYVNSTYLSQFFTSTQVSLLFVGGGLGEITLLLLAPRFIRWFSKSASLSLIMFILAIANFTSAYVHTPFGAAFSFLSYSSLVFLAYYCLDIFVEELSTDRHTGGMRGLYGTFMNGGVALGPLLGTFVLERYGMESLYVVGALLLFTTQFLTGFLRRYDYKNFHHQIFHLPFKKWWRKINIRRVTFAKLVLETFFGLMVIYTPLYLHGELGFGWGELGIIFTVALLPFMFLEWPAGELADRLWGEKEMMSAGFFITGCALLFMPFIDKVFLAWLLILFFSRIGASIVEITTDSYFFKQVSADDVGLLSIFRITRPLGVALGATLGAISVHFLSIQPTFFVLAFVVFLGIRESAKIKDTL